jgi:hypothetical protein
LSYSGKRGSSYGSQIRRARRVQARRSDHAKAIDERLKASRAKSVEQWLSAPNRYDLPTVDENRPKKEALSMSMTAEQFWKNHETFDRLINKDDIEEKNLANQKMVKQILKTLDENKIPYYNGGEDTGVQVPKSDVKRAESLTDKLYGALKKTL